jgi:iron complex outermembrane receptor protein
VSDYSTPYFGSTAARRRAAFMSVSLSALLWALPGAAMAQAAGHAQVEEVVVTAQKRAQNLQDVPVAVTALTEDTLTANRVTTVRDLTAAVPNLVVRTQVGGSGLPNYTMRGLVGHGGTIGADKGISIYFDGVYLSSSYGSVIELSEIERVEVLRGPQGTLFGRNSTGGAISFITPEPSGEFRLKQIVSVGNYDQFRTVTSLHTPQWGPFSARFSYTHSERRGDIRNLGAGTRWDFSPAFGGKSVVLTSPKWLGGYNNEAFAGVIKFEPDEKFDAVLRFDYSESDFSAEGWGATWASPSTRAIVAAQPNQALMTPISNKRPKALNNASTVPSHSEAWGAALTTTYQVSDEITVKNILAYRKTKFSSPWTETTGFGGLINTGGAAFTPASVLGAALAASTLGAPYTLRASTNTGAEKQWTDELQLNIDTSFVTLTAGAMYFELTVSRAPFGEEVGLGRARASANMVFPGRVVPFAGQPIGTRGRETTLKVRSYAGYGQAEVHLTDQLDVIGGIRYTKDRKKGVDLGQYSGLAPTVVLLEYRGDEITYNLGVNYEFGENFNAYGKYSTGFISGGGSYGITFDPETAKSWEVGLKADWLDRRLRTNLALFSVKYGGLHAVTSGLTLVPPQPSVNLIIINSGDARAKGVELETTFTPLTGLTLSAGVGYTDFKFLRLSPSALAGQAEFGEAYRPKWTANLSAQYESRPLFDEVRLNARVDASYRSKQLAYGGVAASLAVAERALFKSAGVIPGHWLANGRVALEGFRIGGGEATLALWGRNLFNSKAINYSIPVVVSLIADYERARTFGVDLTLEF